MTKTPPLSVAPPAPPAQAWHTMPPGKVVASLGASATRGLSGAEVASRALASGPNLLPEATRRSLPRMIVEHSPTSWSSCGSSPRWPGSWATSRIRWRSSRSSCSMPPSALGSNHVLTLVVLGTVLLQLLTLYVPFLNAIFKTQPLSGPEPAITCGASTMVLLAVEVEKGLVRHGHLEYRGGAIRAPR